MTPEAHFLVIYFLHMMQLLFIGVIIRCDMNYFLGVFNKMSVSVLSLFFFKHESLECDGAAVSVHSVCNSSIHRQLGQQADPWILP